MFLKAKIFALKSLKISVIKTSCNYIKFIIKFLKPLKWVFFFDLERVAYFINVFKAQVLCKNKNNNKTKNNTLCHLLHTLT